jgi:hypothetical protein
MTIFESINSKNIDEFAKWLDKYGAYEDLSWMKWWNENYCQKCEMVTIPREEYARIVGWKLCSDYHGNIDCGYCEVNGRCRYFEDMDEVPDSIEIIKLWLETEAEDEASI